MCHLEAKTVRTEMFIYNNVLSGAFKMILKIYIIKMTAGSWRMREKVYIIEITSNVKSRKKYWPILIN